MRKAGARSFLAAAWAALAPAAAAAQDHQRLALVVGIDRYEPAEPAGEARSGASGFSNLHGAVNDAERVRALLRDRFDFPERNILVLTDEAASHAGIVAAFHRHLIDRAGPDSEVVFWYSGHGSRVPDGSPGGHEPEGKDSTLVAFDSRRAPDVPDLSDDELYSLLAALCERTSLVTVVTDCCHSGGVTRGPAGRRGRYARDGDAPVRLADLGGWWPAELPFYDDGDPRRAAALPYVHIAACAAGQQAQEHYPGGPGAAAQQPAFGALTWFLCEAMERMEPGTSYAELVAATALRLARHHEDQDVHVEGPAERVVLGGAFAAPLPGFAARAQPGSRWVEIAAGALQQLGLGMEMEVRALHGAKLGRCRIEELEPYAAAGSWLGEPPALDGPVALRAVPEPAAAAGGEMALFVGGGAGAVEIQAALAAARPPFLRLVEQPEAAGYQLYQEPGSARWRLATAPAGRALWVEAEQAPEQETAERVAVLLERLRWESRYQALLELAEAGGGIGVAARFEPMAAATLEEWRVKLPGRCIEAARLERMAGPGEAGEQAGALVAYDRGGEEIADVVELVVEVSAEQSLDPHVAVLCASEDRSVRLVWPEDGRHRDNLVAPGRPLRIPLVIFLNPGWPEARPLRDRYLVIATLQHVDLSIYEQSGPPPASGAGDRLRGGAAGLPPLLQRALAAGRTRGGALDSQDFRFGVCGVDLLVAKE